MFMGKQNLFPILAIVVLMIGIFSSLYVTALSKTQNIDEGIIKINEIEFLKIDFLKDIEKKTIITDRGEKTGYALDSIILKSGVSCPECHKYTFKAVLPDPYQQTVDWEDIKTGIFSLDRDIVYFPYKTHSFWVYNIVEIEVD